MDASNNNVVILMNQTTLTREECEKQLKDNNNNVFDCLMKYYKLEKREQDKCKTSNQERYRQIRNLLN